MVETFILILIFVVFSALALRLFGVEFNPFAESESSSGITAQVNHTENESGVKIETWGSPVSVPERGKRLSFGSIIAFLILLLIGWAWAHFGSFDAVFQKVIEKYIPVPAAAKSINGADWAVVDGVRWFKVLGTDSVGIGFGGWVSEMAFKGGPPASVGSTSNRIMQKLGLPTPEESIKGYKQLHSLGKDLKKQLGNNQ